MSEGDVSSTSEVSDSAQIDANVDRYLEKLRPKMLRFVTMQLGDENRAEDLVQDALLGALRNATSFRGEAAFKTWVFSILKRKIADHFRLTKKAPPAESSKRSAMDEGMDILFDHRGHWHTHFQPVDWGDPVRELSNTQFWTVFDTCLNELPEKQCTIFMMREYIGLSTEEIRRALGISTSLVNVTLYRARIRLQQCLTIRWFGENS